MTALRGDLEDHGGSIAFNTRIERLVPGKPGWKAGFGDEPLGHEPHGNSTPWSMRPGSGRSAWAPRPKAIRPRGCRACGSPRATISACAGRPAFSRLIYPVPVPGGLGVHVTLDLAGRMRFGPDVEWIDAENYDVDPGRAAAFYRRIRDYWPGLPDGALLPDYAGIRPKLTGPGEPAADFMIDAPRDHGLAGLVHLFGIELPGLTCGAVAGAGGGGLSLELSLPVVAVARRRRALLIAAGRARRAGGRDPGLGELALAIRPQRRRPN